MGKGRLEAFSDGVIAVIITIMVLELKVPHGTDLPAVLPLIPAGVVVWLVVRQLGRLDEVQKRTQMQALGFSMAATALVTFGYGFLESAGLPRMSATFVLPLMAAFWGLGLVALGLRYRFRR